MRTIATITENKIRCFLLTVLFAFPVLTAAQLIDFEPAAGFDPQEGQPLDNAYMEANYGLRFYLEMIGGDPPTVSQTGNPRTAFASSTFFTGCGTGPSQDDNIYDGGSDCFFITDDGLLAPVTYDLLIDYLSDDCCSTASGELLDVDQGEGWLIEVFSPGIATPVASYTLCGSGCDFGAAGDGKASSWNIDVFPNTIDYLRFSYNSSGGPAAVGIGFDNFQFCGNEPPVTVISDELDLCEIDTVPIWRGIPIEVEGFYLDSSDYDGFCDTIYELLAVADSVFTDAIVNVCNLSDTGTTVTVFNTPEGCDSIHTEYSILEISDTIYDILFTCDPSLEGTDTSYILDESPCDIYLFAEYSLLPSDTTLLFFSTCDPDSVGITVDYLQNQAGCDSIVYTEVYLAGENVLTQETVYSCSATSASADTFYHSTAEGCDSIHIVNTIPAGVDTVYSVLQTCDPSMEGLDSILVVEADPCDSVYVYEYEVLPSDSTVFNIPVCDPDSVGTIVNIHENQQGCDSTVIVFFYLIGENAATQEIEFSCENSEVTVDTFYYSTVAGCDSLYILTQIPAAADTVFVPLPVCDPALEGLDSTVIIESEPCDSVVVFEYVVLSSDTAYFAIPVCQPDSTGTQIESLQNSSGCDSIVITDRFLNPDTAFTYSEEFVCGIMDTITEINYGTTGEGCDSVHTRVRIPVEQDTVYSIVALCDEIRQDTSYRIVSQPCDTVVLIDYQTFGSDTTLIISYVCNPAQVDTQLNRYTNNAGCDSVVIRESLFQGDTIFTFSIEYLCSIQDTIQDSSYHQAVNGCDSIHTFIWIPLLSDTIHRELFTCDPLLVGTDSTFLIEGEPCDSIGQISWVLQAPDTSYTTYNVCDVTNLDTLETVLTNSSGCDSLVIAIPELIGVTIVTFETLISCDADTLMTDTSFATTAAGCDSLHIQTLVPAIPDSTLDYRITCDPGMAGMDSTFIYTDEDGCDSVVLYSFVYVPSDTTILQSSTCDSSAVGYESTHYVNATGCDSLVITNYTYSELQVELKPDTAIYTGQAVLLQATANFTPVEIQWEPPGPDAAEWLVHPESDGLYTIEMTDSAGCPGQASVFITILEDGRIYIPTAFTPNGDGINDRWTVFPTESIEVLRMEIYERWGNKVWEAEGLDQWDGTFKGKLLDANMLVGVVTYRLPSGQTGTETVEIYLIR